jgi:hypothetical protein
MKGKSNLQFMFILMAAFLLFAGVFLATTRTNYVQKAGNDYESYTKVQGDGDLDRASSTLDGTDLESLDSEIEQNELDSSSY